MASDASPDGEIEKDIDLPSDDRSDLGVMDIGGGVAFLGVIMIGQ